jgi:hypothetical protein
LPDFPARGDCEGMLLCGGNIPLLIDGWLALTNLPSHLPAARRPPPADRSRALAPPLTEQALEFGQLHIA